MRSVVAAAFSTAITAGSLVAQSDACRVLCVPAVSLEPTVTVTNLFGAARVARGQPGGLADTMRLDRETEFELILAVDVPTELSRLELTIEAMWQPFADDNAVELENELNLILLTGAETDGWVGAHFDVVDKFSPAERAGSERAYTHKLNFELDIGVAVMRWLPSRSWLRALELELSLDYVATGLARRGDDVEEGRLLDDASPWSLSFVGVVPVAPLVR